MMMKIGPIKIWGMIFWEYENNIKVFLFLYKINRKKGFINFNTLNISL